MAERQWLSWQGEDLSPEFDFTEPTSNVHVIWPEIEVGGRAWKGESDVGSVPMRDERGETGSPASLPAGLSHISLSAHNRWRWTERHGSNTMARGWIGPKDYRRDRQGGLKPDRHREVTMSVVDANAQLQGIIVDANRDAETDVARVQWLLSTYLSGSPRPTTNIASTYLATGSNTVALPAQHVFGDPRSVLEEIANLANKQFFVTSDEELFYDGNDSAAYVAGLRISDRPDELSSATSSAALAVESADVIAGTISGSGTSDRPAIVVGGSDRYVLFFLASAYDTVPNATADYTPDLNAAPTATWYPMTVIADIITGQNLQIRAFGLWDPPASVGNGRIRWDYGAGATGGNGAETRAAVSAASITGYVSDPTADITTDGAGPANGSPASNSITAETNDLVIAHIYGNTDPTAHDTSGAGQTEHDYDNNSKAFGAISSQAGAGGSTTSGWTWTPSGTGSDDWVMAQLVLPAGDLPTFPPIWDVGPAATEDGQQLLSGVRLYYGQGSNTYVYVNDPTTANQYAHFEESLYAPDSITTAAAATTLANVILAKRKYEDRNINVSIGPLTDEQAVLVKYGQLIDIKARAIAFADDAFFTGRIRQLRWTTPVPDMFFAHMQIERPIKDLPYGVGNKGGSSAVTAHLEQGSNAHPEYVLKSTLAFQGDIPYRGASDWTRLGIGASNTWLKSTGVVPLWATLPASAGTITVKEVDGTPNVSGVSTVVVSNGTLTDDGSGQVTVTTGGGGGGIGDHGAHAYHDAAQAITTATDTVVALNSERYDTDAYHDTATNNSRLTVPSGQAGKYIINFNCDWAANSTGIREARIRKNGTTYLGLQTVDVDTIDGIRNSVTALAELAETDYVEAVVRQTSGGNLNLLSNAQYSPEFSLQRLA